MQITPIIICLMLISIVQAALVTRIPKPKLNLVHSQNLQIPETPKHKSPEERRKLSLFPKSYMKYVISSEPIYKIATQKPIVHGTKKPLMKKLHLLENKNKPLETEIEQPIINTKSNENNLDVTPKGNFLEISKENVEENSEEISGKQNYNSNEEDKLQVNSNEKEKSTADTANKDTTNLKYFIIPHEAKPDALSEKQSKEIVEESNEKQNYDSEEEELQNDSHEMKNSTADIVNMKRLIHEAKPLEVSTENKNIEAFVDASKNSKEDETPDWTEFIFIDPAQKPSETDKNSSEEPEEYITTEYSVEPELARIKRGSNVIEEENLATTVAGYKYTWKDTRLNNHVAFKNINS